MKLLWIGNSATYVHQIPQTLERLAAKAGYAIEVAQIAKGGYELAQHADLESEHGQLVLRTLQASYDVVFLQDNGNCIANEKKRTACQTAAEKLCQIIRESGAKPSFYVRPPYGKEANGYTPFEQCIKFDALFGKIAHMQNMDCVYVNRAFAEAMQNTPFDLWGPDHAHTSLHGAYLAVCTFFVSLFGVSATCLDADELPFLDAKQLQKIADRIVLDHHVPWNETYKNHPHS